MVNIAVLQKPYKAKEMSHKLSKLDVISIKGYIYESDISILENGKCRRLNSKEFIKHMANEDVNEVTEFYIKQCKKLKNYDLRNVDQNLKDLNLI